MNNFNQSIIFQDSNNVTCGKLTFDNGQLSFEGNAEKSAERFIDYLLHIFNNKNQEFILQQKTNMVIDKDGTIRYYKNGKLHNDNGPAIEYVNTAKAWLINGQFHRKDGPAIEYVNGSKEWWINGKFIKSENN